MKRQLHELTKEELIAVVQDYQEVVSDVEEVIQNRGDPSLRVDIRDCLYRHRPGWDVLRPGEEQYERECQAESRPEDDPRP